MNKIMFKGAFIAAAATALSTPAHAAFTVANSNGGDGYVNANAGGFDLYGADNGVGSNLTTYTDTAASAETLIFNYVYTTNDVDGAYFDPAGYTINGNLFQLSPASSASGFSGGGTVSLVLNAGDNYGFYVNSVDSAYGRGDIAVTAAVPEPATWALMLVGFGAVGYAMRKRPTVRVSHTFA